MDWGAVDYQLVRRMAVESLGPAAAKHSKSLFIDVCLVFLSAKPALLLDCVCTDLITLAAFVGKVERYLRTTLTTSSAGNLSPVRILRIEEDLVVIGDSHYRRVEEQLSQGGGSEGGGAGGGGRGGVGGGAAGIGGRRTSDEDGDSSRPSLKSIVFVDVTGTLRSPRLLDDTTLASLLEWISLTFANATTVDRPESESGLIPLVDFAVASHHHEGRCVPSLFGVLLGYPVVYFTSTDDNCLAFTPLKLISLTCRMDSLGFEHDCLSFSIPDCLYDDDDDEIVASLRPSEKRLMPLFSTVRLRVKDVTQNSISL